MRSKARLLDSNQLAAKSRPDAAAAGRPEGLNPKNGLKQARHKASEPQWALRRGKTDTRQVARGNRRVFQIVIGNLDVANVKRPGFVGKAALQHERQFGSTMPVVGHGRTGRDPQSRADPSRSAWRIC